MAQSTSFSSRTTLPIETRKKKQNYVSVTNVDYSLVFISWNSMVQFGSAQLRAAVFHIKHCLNRTFVSILVVNTALGHMMGQSALVHRFIYFTSVVFDAAAQT